MSVLCGEGKLFGILRNLYYKSGMFVLMVIECMNVHWGIFTSK